MRELARPARALRRLQLVCVTALLLTLALTGPASGAAPEVPYVPALLTWHEPGDFQQSRNGNPINGAGLVAGSVLVEGRHRAAVLNTRTDHVYLLDGLPTACETWAVDVNVRAHVAGYQQCTEFGFQVGFFWSSPTAAVRYLDPAPQTNSRPHAMNDRDVLVGEYAGPDSGGLRAFVWSASTGSLRLLKTLGGNTALAYGINNGGFVTGTSETGRGQYRPFVWLPASQVVSEIGTPPRWQYAAGYDINDRGYVVGGYSDGSTQQPFVWSPRTRLVSPLPSQESNVIASAVNQGGVVVGQVDSPRRAAVVWDTCGGPLRELPAPAGSTDQFAVGINIYGRIVGESTSGSPTTGWTFSGTQWDKPPADRGAVALPCHS